MQGHFAQRSLPSNGLLPFLGSLACQLNNSCYSLPQDNDAPPSKNISNSNQLNQLTQLAADAFEFASRQEVISSVTTLANAFRDFTNIRNKAGLITQNLTLSQYLYISADSLKNQLIQIVNDTVLVNDLLNSNPNYNYLFSNFSRNITEPIPQLNTNISPQLIDLAYGPDLDVNI
jgi:hypothetical protein